MSELSEMELDQFTEVESSMIKSLGTNGDDLIVAFKKGGNYRYPGLAHEFVQLTSAASVGKYFHQEVRDQPCQRISEVD